MLVPQPLQKNKEKHVQNTFNDYPFPVFTVKPILKEFIDECRIFPCI